MALNENQMGQILWHLENRVGESRCRMCGGSELKVHPDLAGTPLVELNGNGMKIYARDVTPLVQVVCENCYHVEYFMAEGVLKSKQ